MANATVLFDINETVLDLSSLKPLFMQVFGNQSALPLWFSRLLHTSTVCVVTKLPSQFAELAAIALDAEAQRWQVSLSPERRQQILAGFAALKPHPDVEPALKSLRASGLRTVAFSNSSLALITTQINQAGLSEHFDRIISVEGFNSFKPDPQVYQRVAEELGAPIAELRLVACHDWDSHGALNAGMQAAYLDRSGQHYHPLYRQPDIMATSMSEIADLIIARTAL
ncbi:haloacid dehalogenase type II [Aliagarivorans marinus]|uniref:haloacid dehalogenase type II n=1 Tax=Aliagarivorans marinus TaxID=561965 RepID=UPI000400A769|nr:haloacid dehalogenase type II [Aliagarivorans marinus]